MVFPIFHHFSEKNDDHQKISSIKLVMSVQKMFALIFRKLLDESHPSVRAINLNFVIVNIRDLRQLEIANFDSILG